MGIFRFSTPKKDPIPAFFWSIIGSIRLISSAPPGLQLPLELPQLHPELLQLPPELPQIPPELLQLPMELPQLPSELLQPWPYFTQYGHASTTSGTAQLPPELIQLPPELLSKLPP